ncbi:DNA cytosine methyltransferase [Rhizobium leguminosarum]
MPVKRRAISLFSGAGGMDIGFARAGFQTLLACELDKDACETFNANLHAVGHLGNRIQPTSIVDLDLQNLPTDVDVVFGGPPCQGFSVAGKMDPNDERSKLIHSFFDVVDAARPRGFVCENVKNLAVSARWADVRNQVFGRSNKEYHTALIILNATDFGVPQMRERMFLVGIRKDLYGGTDQTLQNQLKRALAASHKSAPTIAEVVKSLGRAGTKTNPHTCTAKISFAKAPVMRKSPYAGMLFNGAGRPLSAKGWATTLPASMGGNKTPIVDEREIFDGFDSFVQQYHRELVEGANSKTGQAPSNLRRLTINECMAIQTFPVGYQFRGSKSAIYRQLGNAVPCDLAEAVARAFNTVLTTCGKGELDECTFVA